MKADVSVVVPTYNRSSLLERSLESVLDQTMSPMEVIVVDDGSEDDTRSVVEALNDPRLAYRRHDVNRGAAAARNTGLEEAEGRYIAFQDSDDVWHPDKLERQLKLFDRAPDSVGFVFSGLWRHKDDGKIFYPPLGTVRRKLSRSPPEPEDFLLEQLVPMMTLVVRAECFDEVGGFEEGLPRFQDWELSIRLAQSYRGRYVNRPLVESYVQPDSLTKNHPAFIEARESILQKHRDLFHEHPKILASHYYRMANYAVEHNLSGIKAADYYWRAVDEHPFRGTYWAAWLLSLMGDDFLEHARRLKRTLSRTET